MEEQTENEQLLEEKVVTAEVKEVPAPIKVGAYELPTLAPVEVEVPTDPNVKKVPFRLLSPLQKIKMAAAQNGVTTLVPKPTCKKCYGRGYVSQTSISVPEELSASDSVSIDDEGKVSLPNACKCIFNKTDRHKMFSGQFAQSNRVIRRLEKQTNDQKGRDKSRNIILSDVNRQNEIKKKKKKLRKLKSKAKRK